MQSQSQELKIFTETLGTLQTVGGNYHFEMALFRKIAAAGTTIGQLTVDEFIRLHNETNDEFNAKQQRLDEMVADFNNRKSAA